MKPLYFAILLLVGTAIAQEDRQIAILKSDSSLQEKSDACRELARIGTRESAPVLASLLADEKLSHMARYALETIADPAVDDALRDALAKTKGQSLVGVISSLGVRKNPAAIEPLGRLLADTDPVVAQAAARALGSIGGEAVPVLEKFLTTSSGPNQLAVCEGLLRCAKVSSGDDAVTIYDKLRVMPKLPLHLRVAALRGSILSRGDKGLPILLESIRDDSLVSAAEVLRISMEMPGARVTEALVGELATASAQKQILLAQSLGCRGDAAALPGLVKLAQGGAVDLRIAALHSISQIANDSSLPILTKLATDPEAAVASEALAGLIAFPGKQADAALLALLNGSAPSLRVALINALGQRRMVSAVPALAKEVADADEGVANASLKVLRELGGVEEIPSVILAMSQASTAASAESALAAICARQTDKSLVAEKLLAAFDSSKGEPKLALLRVLGKIGDLQTMEVVRKASTDADATVKGTALQVLQDWPADAGFTSIFNGKDLSGWNGKPGWWTVEDGALTAESTPEKPCKKCNYLIWRGDHPADFELLADFKLSSKANSGIQIRSEELLDWDTSGYQADMTGDGALVGFVYHHKRGLIAGRGENASFAADGKKTVELIGTPEELLKHYKQGDWNTYHVVCRGPEITLSVNDVLMCKITDHHAKQAADRGLIALQMHPGPPMKIQFKNIRVKMLK